MCNSGLSVWKNDQRGEEDRSGMERSEKWNRMNEVKWSELSEVTWREIEDGGPGWVFVRDHYYTYMMGLNLQQVIGNALIISWTNNSNLLIHPRQLCYSNGCWFLSSPEVHPWVHPRLAGNLSWCCDRHSVQERRWHLWMEFHRKLTSRVANFIAKTLLGSNCSDLTGSFR